MDGEASSRPEGVQDDAFFRETSGLESSEMSGSLGVNSSIPSMRILPPSPRPSCSGGEYIEIAFSDMSGRRQSFNSLSEHQHSRSFSNSFDLTGEDKCTPRESTVDHIDLDPSKSAIRPEFSQSFRLAPRFSHIETTDVTSSPRVSKVLPRASRDSTQASPRESLQISPKSLNRRSSDIPTRLRTVLRSESFMSLSSVGSIQAAASRAEVDVEAVAFKGSVHIVKTASEQLIKLVQDFQTALPHNLHVKRLLEEYANVENQLRTREEELGKCEDQSDYNLGNLNCYMLLEGIYARLRVLGAFFETSRLPADGSPMTICNCLECSNARNNITLQALHTVSKEAASPPTKTRSFSITGLQNLASRRKLLDASPPPPPPPPSSLPSSPSSASFSSSEPVKQNRLTVCLIKFYTNFLKLGGAEMLLPLMCLRVTWNMRGLDEEGVCIDTLLHVKVHVAVLAVISACGELMAANALDNELANEFSWWSHHDSLLSGFFRARALRIGNHVDYVSWEFLEAGLQIITEGRTRPIENVDTYSPSSVGILQFFNREQPLSTSALFLCVSHTSVDNLLLVFKHLTFAFAQTPSSCSLLLRMPHWQDLVWPYVMLTGEDLGQETGSMALHMIVTLLLYPVFVQKTSSPPSLAALLAETVDRLVVVTQRAPSINMYVRQVLQALVTKVVKTYKNTFKDTPDHPSWEPFICILEAVHYFAWFGRVPGQAEETEGGKDMKSDVELTVRPRLPKLRAVLADPSLLRGLQDYVNVVGTQKQELWFWTAVQEYQQFRLRYQGIDQRLQAAEDIYATYLQLGASEELTLIPQDQREHIKELLVNDHKCEAFDELQGLAADQVEQGVFVAFVQSAHFRSLVKAIEVHNQKRQQKGSGRLHYPDEHLGIHCDPTGSLPDLPLIQSAVAALQGVGRTVDGKESPGWASNKISAKKLNSLILPLREELQAGLLFLQSLERKELPTRKLDRDLAVVLARRHPLTEKHILQRLPMLSKEHLLLSKQGRPQAEREVKSSGGPPFQRPTVDTYTLQEKRKLTMGVVRSEQEYVNELMNLSTVYIAPLVDNHMEVNDPDSLKRFLGSLHQIAVIHARMLKELRKCAGYMEICKVLEDYVQFFKCYFFYAQSVPVFLLEFEDNKTVSKFLDDTSSFQGHEPFRTLLGRPLLRVPEYVRVLEDLDQNTPAGHDDLTAITRCLQSVKATAALINEHKSKSENSAQLYRLHTLVTGIPDDWNILGPSRHFMAAVVCSEVFPGALLKPPQHPTKNTRRLILMGDALVVTTWEFKYLARMELLDPRPSGRLVIQLWAGLHTEESEPTQAFMFDTLPDRDRWLGLLLAARATRTTQIADLEARGAGKRRGHEDGQLIKVCLRVRPFATELERSVGQTCIEVKNKMVTLKQPNGIDRVCHYDHVFTPLSTQDDVFDSLGRETLGAVFSGTNVCIFAYGNTGAGKTYTMFGPPQPTGTETTASLDDKTLSEGQECFVALEQSFALAVVERLPKEELKTVQVRLVESEQVVEVDTKHVHWGEPSTHQDQRGLVPRLLDWLFMVLKHGSYQQARIKLGYMQVYNGEVHDLLVPNAVDLKISRNAKGHHAPKGLSYVVVPSASEAMALINTGNTRRVTRAHHMNALSSRSHAIVVLRIAFKNQGKKTRARVHLVDLAGSEALEHEDPMASPILGVSLDHTAQLKEDSKFINQSLVSLGRVVFALIENTKRVKEAKVQVPFRDSKLTLLLSEVLHGDFSCTLILNISPSPVSGQNHLSAKTMAFGEGIKRLPSVKSSDKGVWYSSLWSAISRGK